jgi:hypothetical protein
MRVTLVILNLLGALGLLGCSYLSVSKIVSETGSTEAWNLFAFGFVAGLAVSNAVSWMAPGQPKPFSNSTGPEQAPGR